MSEKTEMKITDFDKIEIGKYDIGQAKDKFYITPHDVKDYRDLMPFSQVGLDGDKVEITKKLFIKLGGKVEE